jgi:UDP-N-acetylglucosamine--N-acetylmuramyl-(pentapeptide) pyrophosphoryl-undecaprenol N-acetylglucosamine transferase
VIESHPALAGRKLLLCASTGGHLWQLERIARAFDVRDDSLWVTFDTPQARSLLQGRRVLYVPYISPRDFRGVLKATVAIDHNLRNESFDGVLTTGAGLALSTILPATRHGLRRLYIESVSRVTGPSLSGRIVHATRVFETWTQHAGWASGRWTYHGSILGNLTPRIGAEKGVRRVFVTLGTIKPYPFSRLVEHLATLLPPEVEVVWQLGVTQAPPGLRGTVHQFMSSTDFTDETRRADVVIPQAVGARGARRRPPGGDRGPGRSGRHRTRQGSRRVDPRGPRDRGGPGGDPCPPARLTSGSPSCTSATTPTAFAVGSRP